MRVFTALILIFAPAISVAAQPIRVVGSSTVYPFISAAAEQFGRTGAFRTPIVESTGTGGGLKMFCDGDGPDIANASRPIKPVEVEQCHKAGITDIMELKIGYDGIVFAMARGTKPMKLSKRSLFLAMAREVPKNGALVPNFYTSWKQIDPALPDTEIRIYGPPPVEGTRDALTELVMEEGCKGLPEFAAIANEPTRKQRCGSMREDGYFIEILGGNIMVQKLVNNPHSMAIFGYSFLEQNTALVHASPVDGVLPDTTAITTGRYSVARSLYMYVNAHHADAVAGLREFVRFVASDATTGADGYLGLKGLLPLPAAEHEAGKKKAAAI